MWWLWQLLRNERFEVCECVDDSEFRRDDAADDLRRLLVCREKRAAMRGGGAQGQLIPASSERIMSGSSGMSSFSRWSCELTISTSESEKDMMALAYVWRLIQELCERVGLSRI
jgi:hypothetical protein